MNTVSSSFDAFRPIHYLGSKLRFLDAIEEAIDELDPSMGRVCDLFAGSATVALRLSKSRAVTASDIQEYSRVLASALLQSPFNELNGLAFCEKAMRAKFCREMYDVFDELLEYEDEAIDAARRGSPDSLLEIIEKGSIVTFMEEGSECGHCLEKAIRKSADNLYRAGIADSVNTLATRHFGGLYLSYRQALLIDILLAENDLNENRAERDFVLAAIISVLSQEANTVGKQFAQPMKVRDSSGEYKYKLASKAIHDRSLDTKECFLEQLELFEKAKTCRSDNHVVRADYRELLRSMTPGGVSIIYADPPYSRYHYSRYYHVLETIALRDNPMISNNPATGRISRGVYRKDRHQSPFSIKSMANDAFLDLFSLSASLECPLVLSYSPYPNNRPATPRMMTIDKLIQCARCYYEKVQIRPISSFLHSKLNSSERNFSAVDLSELLVLCSNPKGF